MKRIVFEGTEEQFVNLQNAMWHSDNDMPEMKTKYQVRNLWSSKDVQSKYECTDEEAMDIIENVMSNDGITMFIWDTIDDHAESAGLKRIKEVTIVNLDNTWSIYDDSGQCLEPDFEFEEDAVAYAKDQNWNVVDFFNTKLIS